MTNRLVVAFQSPVLGWLTVAFFLTASVVTYAKRVDQYKRDGALPADAQSAPGWVTLFFWVETALKIALVALNWQLGLVVYVLGFALAVLGVLERAGDFLMYFLVPTRLPNDQIRGSDYSGELAQRMAVRMEKNSFIFRMLLLAGAYLGLSLLLNVVRKDAAAVFLWGLIGLRWLMYLDIFLAAAARARECGYRVYWLGGVLAVLGRVNDFEVFVIPAVVVASLAVSEKGRTLKPSAEVTDEDAPEDGGEVSSRVEHDPAPDPPQAKGERRRRW